MNTEILKHDEENRYEPFRLSDMQQALLIGRGNAVEFGDVGCHAYCEHESNDLNLEAYKNAWLKLIERHDMLRAVFHSHDETQQVLREVPPFEVQVVDLREESDDKVEEILSEIRERMSHQVLPADKWPLLEVVVAKLKDNYYRLFTSIDLLIMDAWSYFQIILPDLIEVYNNPDHVFPELEVTFRDYITKVESELEDTEEYQLAKQYWMERLPNLPPAASLPQISTIDPNTEVKFNSREYVVKEKEWSEIKAQGRRRGVTPSIIMVSAFAEVIRKWSGNDAFTINFPIYDRKPVHPQINNVLGDFTNNLLVSIEKSDGNFTDRAKSIQRQVIRDLEHRQFSGVRVLRELMRLQKGVGALAPIVVTSLLGNPTRHEMTSFGREVHAITQTPQVLLDFQISEFEGELRFNWDSLDAHFPEGMLDDMFEVYCNILRQLEHDENWGKEGFEMLPQWQIEQHDVINATDGDVPDLMLHEMMMEVAKNDPNTMAVISSSKQLTYSELSHRANQIGRKLRETGARPNELVAIVMDKGWEQYAAVYGVLVAGSAYLPIDPSMPQERLEFMLKEGEVSKILTQSEVNQRLQWPEGLQRSCVDCDFDDVDSSPLESIQTSDDLAYVIYTSGSTGKPKGTMVAHRGVVNMLFDIKQRCNLSQGDRAFAISSLQHDASVFDVFAIGCGIGNVVPDPTPNPEPAHWVDMIRAHDVTFWNSVPAFMDILLSYVEGKNELQLKSLREVILSGDFIPITMPNRLRNIAPEVNILSAGGPTETIVWSISYPIEDVDPNWVSIPYGRPTKNHKYFILDKHLSDQPVWVPGEMYDGSEIGLAKGFWRNEALTNQRFIKHPRTGQRMYATGDMGRYLPDGNIEILGRNDFQVQINGHRIELGEIEACLKMQEGVRSAVAVVIEGETEHKWIVAFVEARLEDKHLLDQSLIKEVFEKKLPNYMIPSHIEILEKLPLSDNGKIDRLQLTKMAKEYTTSDFLIEYVTPRTELEAIVASLMGDVLNLERVGVLDNFFDLGGDSISATRLNNRIEEMLGISMPLSTLFKNPTVEKICSFLNQGDDSETINALTEMFSQIGIGELYSVVEDLRKERV
ncbi:non-ribosomal peptide synthetase [Bacillus halotolerans]|uniref:non-ribosomal peptide synthetase n=1 Tax=Bacillus halotolerans TaxID=260554 RepID=UPI002DC039EB|nr:amino acid adenylation domain-containing protein [Bacillus halotolerans]MEC1646348.1 amino acid adenylation domain-containing protein [Bacillus halotolerans]